MDVYTENLFKHLVKNDNEIEYIFIVNNISSKYFRGVNDNIKYVYPSRMLDTPVGKILWYILFVRAFIKKNNIDLVFNNTATGNFILTKIVPVVSCVHDLAEFYIKNKYSFWRMIYRKYICLKINKYLTTHFIAISENTKMDIVKFLKISSNNITVILNGANHLNKNSEDSIETDQAKGKYILYVGRLDPFGKNLLNLIDAFKILVDRNNNIKLYLVGKEARGTNLILQKINDLSLNENVHISGYVNTDKLISLYKNALVFIFPSLYEGFGFPILEAMKYGIPVVCSNASSLPEIGGEAAVYFDPFTFSDIAEKINLVIENNKLMQELSSKGKIRYQLFKWENSAYETSRIIANILGNH